MEWCWVFVGSAGLTPVPHPTQTCLSLFFGLVAEPVRTALVRSICALRPTNLHSVTGSSAAPGGTADALIQAALAAFPAGYR